MFSGKKAQLRKSTSNALSSAILMFLFFGFVPPGAQATDVVVQGTVEEAGECEIAITELGTIFLGEPELITDGGSSPYYLFLSESGINLSWSVNGSSDCDGALHAQRGDLTRTVGQETNIVDGLLGLQELGALDITYLDGLGASAQVADSMGTSGGDSGSFDVGLEISEDLGPGLYQSTITFTVVPD